MARVSIYVPDDLKARMDGVGDAVNWSEVARPAFQAAVANHEHREGQTMETAIQRLRASKAESSLRDRDDGKAEGAMVAKDLLDYPELVAISKIDVGQNDEESAYGELKAALDPAGEHSEPEFNELYFTNDGASVSDNWALGFIEGAQDFFKRVRAQI